jgi:hypothetical protein
MKIASRVLYTALGGMDTPIYLTEKEWEKVSQELEKIASKLDERGGA